MLLQVNGYVVANKTEDCQMLVYNEIYLVKTIRNKLYSDAGLLNPNNKDKEKKAKVVKNLLGHNIELYIKTE